ncbi:MAG TPA: hypothetical protein VFV87_04055 [Pirellulaceae bacterium]|nr:hypothetical protein [Pirellulaceae bacterium]
MAEEAKPSGLLPFVRHMIVCEHAEPSPSNPRRTNVYGIFSSIVVHGDAGAFPRSVGFSVYLSLTECRGDGEGRVIVSDAESGDMCYAGAPHDIILSTNPLAIHEVIIRIPLCELPHPGVYLIAFEFDGVVLSQESLVVVVR